jgi:UPF0755 protein
VSPAKTRSDARARRRPLALALLVLLGAAAGGWALWNYAGPGPSAGKDEVTTVFIPSGTGVSGIASRLDAAGAIRSATAFKIAARLTGAGGSLRAGEYEFAPGASMAEVMGKIRRGEIVRHFVTVPEGVTSARVAEILNANRVLEGPVVAPEEGAVLPETYDVHRGETRAAVLKRMTDAQTRLLDELWAARQQGLPVRTKKEAVTLASIVEKETGIASERPRVAAVFVNRLRKGMKLESDPTIIYGLTRGVPLVDAQGRRRGLRRSELERPNPYSTYQIRGLPPTPIANPGRQSLAAVLNPPETDELFFVADGTGGHVFAKTFDEHLRNVAKWRAVERQRAAEAAP